MQHASAIPVANSHARPSAYLGLMKPHVTVLLLGTTLAAMVVAAGGLPRAGLIVAALVGGALAAGSANAINCFWDRDIDRVMSRTRSRALPAGQVDDAHALAFGLSLGAASFIIFARFVNLLSAFLALAAIVFYVCVYTMWLKRSTPQNIVIGGAAGAVPVLVGWAAVTGTVATPALLMFALIFMWTPPHFWALSLVLRKDYERAGVPMLPVVKGERSTCQHIVVYVVLLVGISTLLTVTGTLGLLYLGVALLCGGGLLALALKLARSRTLRDARLLFWCSNYYLALMFAAMVVDRVVLR